MKASGYKSERAYSDQLQKQRHELDVAILSSMLSSKLSMSKSIFWYISMFSYELLGFADGKLSVFLDMIRGPFLMWVYKLTHLWFEFIVWFLIIMLLLLQLLTQQLLAFNLTQKCFHLIEFRLECPCASQQILWFIQLSPCASLLIIDA